MIKRLFDIIVASLVLILFFPFFLILIPFCYLIHGRPLFFIQERPGKEGKPFYMIKLRTMKNLYDDSGKLLDDKYRMTKFGRFLRAASLDELPELINVIKGDMSLVGPRPLLMEYLPLYNDRQFKRHLVRPGITGLAQVRGRNNLSWEERFEYDIEYIEQHSFWLDLKIIFLTVYKVIKKEGVQQKGHVTMTKFKGNSKQ